MPSYQDQLQDFLLQYVKVHPDVVKVFQTAPHDLYGVGVDAVSAYDCARYGYPGFKGDYSSRSASRRRPGRGRTLYLPLS